MPGEKVCIAAATVVALAADLAGTGDQLAVVAFWSDATVVAPLAAPFVTATLLDRLLRIPAKGLTNVGFDLQVAHAELARSGAAHRTAVMLTDAVHNAGLDPRTIARRFPALHVLLKTDGEHDGSLARDLARLGHGRIAPVRTHRDVAPVLNRVLARDGAEAWRPDRQTDNLSETRVSMADGAIKDSWPGSGGVPYTK